MPQNLKGKIITVTNENGRKARFRWNLDRPPSKADFDQVFEEQKKLLSKYKSQNEEMLNAKPQQAPGAPSPDQPWYQTAAQTLGDTALGLIKAPYEAQKKYPEWNLAFPGLGPSIRAMAESQIEPARQARQDLANKDYSSAVGHGLAAVTPMVGPIASQAGEDIGTGLGSGNTQQAVRGAVNAGMILAPMALHEGIGKKSSVTPEVLSPESTALTVNAPKARPGYPSGYAEPVSTPAPGTVEGIIPYEGPAYEPPPPPRGPGLGYTPVRQPELNLQPQLDSPPQLKQIEAPQQFQPPPVDWQPQVYQMPEVQPSDPFRSPGGAIPMGEVTPPEPIRSSGGGIPQPGQVNFFPPSAVAARGGAEVPQFSPVKAPGNIIDFLRQARVEGRIPEAEALKKSPNKELNAPPATNLDQRINARNTLYHSTNAEGLHGILESGQIDPYGGRYTPEELSQLEVAGIPPRVEPRISTSRTPTRYSGDYPATLVIDQSKVPTEPIQRLPKTRPGSQFREGEDPNKQYPFSEAEEQTSKPIPMSAVKEIHLNTADTDYPNLKLDEIRAAASKHGIPVIEGTGKELGQRRVKEPLGFTRKEIQDNPDTYVNQPIPKSLNPIEEMKNRFKNILSDTEGSIKFKEGDSRTLRNAFDKFNATASTAAQYLRSTKIPQLVNVADLINKNRFDKYQFYYKYYNLVGPIGNLKSSEFKEFFEAAEGKPTSNPRVAEAVKAFRTAMDVTHKMQVNAGETSPVPGQPGVRQPLNYMRDYITHMLHDETFGDILTKEWDDFTKGEVKSSLEGVGKGLRHKIAGTKEYTTSDKGAYSTGAPYEKVPTSEYLKERKDAIPKELLEMDPRRIVTFYGKAVGRVVFDKPTIIEARQLLKQIPDGTVAKDTGSWFVEDYANNVNHPAIRALKSLDNMAGRASGRAVLSFSTRLQWLHAARLLTQSLGEVGPKYLIQGLYEFSKNPIDAMRDVRRSGLVSPGQELPFRFKRPTNMVDAIANFGDLGDRFEKAVTLKAARLRAKAAGDPDWMDTGIYETARISGLPHEAARSILTQVPGTNLLAMFKKYIQKYTELQARGLGDAFAKTNDAFSGLASKADAARAWKKVGYHILGGYLAAKITEELGIPLWHISGKSIWNLGSPAFTAITDSMNHLSQALEATKDADPEKAGEGVKNAILDVLKMTPGRVFTVSGRGASRGLDAPFTGTVKNIKSGLEKGVPGLNSEPAWGSAPAR